MKRLLISFSGGETSAFMTWWILNNIKNEYAQIKVVFANTGEEREETLEFIRDCDEHFGFETVWIEGVQVHGERKPPTFRIVDFHTASRNGEPFEDAIKKYGIPNRVFKDCTRNLKRKPIEAYAESLGWRRYTYDLAIGIRVDEVDRMSVEAKKRRIIYPCVSRIPMTKPQINSWWSNQSFRLRLKGYQGNCKWCWKKSIRKHFTLIEESPEIYDFPRRMEQKYPKVGPEFLKTPPPPERYKRTFFRDNMSTDDLFKLYRNHKGFFVPMTDDHVEFDPKFDLGSGCEESCEVFADEDEGEQDEDYRVPSAQSRDTRNGKRDGNGKRQHRRPLSWYGIA